LNYRILRIYKNNETGLSLFNHDTKKEMKIENQYAIVFSPAGPIPKLIMSGSEALEHPESYEQVAQNESTYNFKDAINEIHGWYVNRAKHVLNMKESDLSRPINTEDLYRRWLAKGEREKGE